MSTIQLDKSRLRLSTRLLLSLPSLNGGRQMCTSSQQSLWSLNGGWRMSTSLGQSMDNPSYSN